MKMKEKKLNCAKTRSNSEFSELFQKYKQFKFSYFSEYLNIQNIRIVAKNQTILNCV